VAAADVSGRPQVWPEGIPFMRGLVKYSPAQFTQEIAVTDGRDRISKVHRTRIDDQHKWATPGGLYKVNGWKSDLYKYIPEGGQLWVGDIAVKNSFGYFQNNRGWKRSYPDNALFVDILSNIKSKKVFEARIAEKINGKWQRYVAFKDQSERPPGYYGLKMKCSTCHNKIDGPGTGGYATGLVLGGDEIISDPFPALENQ